MTDPDWQQLAETDATHRVLMLLDDQRRQIAELEVLIEEYFVMVNELLEDDA